jgi:putative acetyltransferase
MNRLFLRIITADEMDIGMDIKPGDLNDPRVIALLEFHVRTARAATAEGSAHALDLNGLRTPDINVWTIWAGETLLGCGALKRLNADHGEVKSMHTAEAARGHGAGGAILTHIIETARAEGLTRLSLETGSWDYFIPARSFYRKHGFVECGPFGDYVPDPNSRFFTLELN